MNPGVGAVVEDMVRPLSAIYVTSCGGTFNPIVTTGTDMLTLGLFLRAPNLNLHSISLILGLSLRDSDNWRVHLCST